MQTTTKQTKQNNDNNNKMQTNKQIQTNKQTNANKQINANKCKRTKINASKQTNKQTNNKQTRSKQTNRLCSPQGQCPQLQFLNLSHPSAFMTCVPQLKLGFGSARSQITCGQYCIEYCILLEIITHNILVIIKMIN